MVFFCSFFFFSGATLGIVAAIKQSIRVQNKYWLLVPCIAFWLSKSKIPIKRFDSEQLKKLKTFKK